MNSQNQPNIILILIDAIIVCGNLTLNHREREEETVERNCMGRRKKQDEKIEQHHHTCVKKSYSGHSVVILLLKNGSQRSWDA
jgi:hypothetical protein